MWWEILVIILSFLLMLVGLAGVVLPILPGIPLAWLGLFIYAIVTGFESISITTVVVFFVLTVLALLIDFLAPMLGAKKYKATKWGVFGSFVGLMVGIIFLGFWGIIIGPFVGAFLAEFLARRQFNIALKTAIGTVIGFLAGTMLKIILIFIMMGFLITALF